MVYFSSVGLGGVGWVQRIEDYFKDPTPLFETHPPKKTDYMNRPSVLNTTLFLDQRTYHAVTGWSYCITDDK